MKIIFYLSRIFGWRSKITCKYSWKYFVFKILLFHWIEFGKTFNQKKEMCKEIKKTFKQYSMWKRYSQKLNCIFLKDRKKNLLTPPVYELGTISPGVCSNLWVNTTISKPPAFFQYLHLFSFFLSASVYLFLLLMVPSSIGG